ncbi:expressed unknown protein [Seminavis robusta]|uniref:Uncharacterized protein n=1 Tax=Seminavis robusta TaxID=568900 RepID=A0A9N8H3H8_9STRA|nr:expressed unknown protein [Seminavis robusta]|eukprot:Sro61_g034890.1 n/a (887) ;mRNA; f:7889-10977
MYVKQEEISVLAFLFHDESGSELLWAHIAGTFLCVYVIVSFWSFGIRCYRRPRIGPSHFHHTRYRLRRRRNWFRRFLLSSKAHQRIAFQTTQKMSSDIRPNTSSDSQPNKNHTGSATAEDVKQRHIPPFRTRSSSSTTTTISNSNSTIEAPVLVYHESARSIVFRDHIRRAIKKGQEEEEESKNRTVTTAFVTELMDANRDAAAYVPPADMLSKTADNDTALVVTETNISNCFQPTVVPLPKLALGPNDVLEELIQSPSGRDGDIGADWTVAETEVVDLLTRQQALVKTIKNTDWASFLHRLQVPKENRRDNFPSEQADAPPKEGYPFTSFVTSCSLLPPGGAKMRAFGSPSQYTAGVVFGLPDTHDSDEAAERTKTWSWPAGYSAKTEFNIDGNGELINGRNEARVSFSTLRQFNEDYLTKEDHMIAGRLVKGGLKVVPYNEIYVRIGGLGRIVNGKYVVTGEPHEDGSEHGRSFDKGLGLPIALFVRTATFGHLISLIRTRARLMHVLGENQIKGIPLLLITPTDGVRVLTEALQASLLKVASHQLNPFQNPTIAHKTTIDHTGEEQLEQKLEELIDLDDNVRKLLTPEECVRLAGGFGATDDSVAAILKEAMIADRNVETSNSINGEGHMLQDLVNEGLAAAVRSGDYYTSRQLLILYSLVASNGFDDDENDHGDDEATSQPQSKTKMLRDATPMSELKESINTISTDLKPPPPPPLDTDRLRSATNSDGLLSVLGAAQVLKSMQDNGAMRRTDEVILALDEWIEHGEQSMAFRLASWRDQRAAQGDLKIAMESSASWMAFISNKAISNRKSFVTQLRQAAQSTDFTDVRFLSAIEAILSRMHSPCLRLELLQYVLGLDNRYSVAHVARSVALAKTCLGFGGG